jgi:hypothetical protein
MHALILKPRLFSVKSTYKEKEKEVLCTQKQKSTTKKKKHDDNM